MAAKKCKKYIGGKDNALMFRFLKVDLRAVCPQVIPYYDSQRLNGTYVASAYVDRTKVRSKGFTKPRQEEPKKETIHTIETKHAWGGK